MNKPFPIYDSHKTVSCFNCGGDLGDYWMDTGYAPGRGQFIQSCEKCRMSTWYDLAKSRKGEFKCSLA